MRRCGLLGFVGSMHAFGKLYHCTTGVLLRGLIRAPNYCKDVKFIVFSAHGLTMLFPGIMTGKFAPI